MDFYGFIHFIFMGIIALFPVVNPIGSAFIVNPYFSQLSPDIRRRAIRRVVFYSFCICVITLLIGHWILTLFGITIPIIQLAGGIMICKIGWEFLSSNNDDSDKLDASKAAMLDNTQNAKDSRIKNQLFYPISFPITTGAGTMSVIFTLSAHTENNRWEDYMLNMGALLISIIAISMLTYIFFSNADKFIRFMGKSGEQILNRIMAFFIFCVGLQIAYGGITTLIHSILKSS